MRATFNPWATLAICALPVAAVGPAFGETKVWTLIQEKAPPQASLTYAVPETDDIFGTFRCTPGSGSVTFFLSTTSTRLKPGRRATATI